MANDLPTSMPRNLRTGRHEALRGNLADTRHVLLTSLNDKPREVLACQRGPTSRTPPGTSGFSRRSAKIDISFLSFSWPPVRVRPGAQHGSDLRLCSAGQSQLRGKNGPGHLFQHLTPIIFNIQLRKVPRFRGSQFPERGQTVIGNKRAFDRRILCTERSRQMMS